MPPNYFLLTLSQLTHVPLLGTSHPVAAAAGSWLADLAPAGNYMDLAGALPSSGGALTRRSFSAEEDGCRVDKRKGTTGLLCPVCYEAVAWPAVTGSGGGVAHPLLTVCLDSLVPTRASLPGSGI